MAARGLSVHPRRQQVWLRILLPNALVVIGAPLIELWSGSNLKIYPDMGYILGLGSLVVFTFYGIWSYERTIKNEPGAIATRDAIAATVVMLYLILLSWAVFFRGGATENSISKITSDLLTSFTSITAVVVAFYFGSITIDQVTRHRQVPSKASKTTTQDPPQDLPERNE
ncbi:hypothetical protein [Arthrobacter sp. B2a2-09]|uniref:hypothetical protein n=1 Tax=Arthrobacter sp. B2a2-09 TaxID=2952822 RepID=UPI0022CD3C37|nr:hypothetical protein [Arthrobacter sp. B2a2-09]MCZ9881676.1 hypothetical protein [Arthrobacter sp. B2a2-09]